MIKCSLYFYLIFIAYTSKLTKIIYCLCVIAIFTYKNKFNKYLNLIYEININIIIK